MTERAWQSSPWKWGVLLLGVFVWAPSPLPAATPENFIARTTADLVTLCSAQPGTVSYEAAIGFCHGFAVGAYQYYAALAAGSPRDRYVCLPNPPPSRSEAIAAFVTWAQADSQRMASPPVDSMFRFLGERYPCRK